MELTTVRLIDLPPFAIHPYAKNARHISSQAIDAVASSIKNFGFKVPIVVDRDNVIVCGHTRLEASKRLGLETVPCVIADDPDGHRPVLDKNAPDEAKKVWRIMEEYKVFGDKIPFIEFIPEIE